MRKIRSDCKHFPIGEAVMLYQFGWSFRELGERYNLKHPNILMRFRRHDIPVRNKVNIFGAEKVGTANKGRRLSQTTIEKIRLANIGKKRSMETRQKMSGENHPNWHGGVSNIHRRIRGTVEAIEWRKAVFARDNYTCQGCGARGGNGKKVVINADHIKPFSQYPELRFDINNGRTLCVPCHKKTPTYGVPVITRKTNPEKWNQCAGKGV